MTETAKQVNVLALLDALALQTKQRGGSPSVGNIEAAHAAVAALITAAELANKAARLTYRSGSERDEVADAFGLPRRASLDDILEAADDRLTEALLTAKGDSAALERRARNSAIVAGLLKS